MDPDTTFLMNATMKRDARSVQLAVMATPSTSLVEAAAEARRLQRTATASIARATDLLRALRQENAAAASYPGDVLLRPLVHRVGPRPTAP